MGLIIGVVLTFGMVFGGYMLAGGKLSIIMYSLPFEMMMIGGAAIGSFIVANSGLVMKKAGAGVLRVMKGAGWKSQDYKDLLCLMYELLKIYKDKGVTAVESHVEDPKQSGIFQKYPKVLNDHFASDLICDSFRMISMNLTDAHQVEENITKKIKKHHHEALAPANALQTMADALPALGIVAAVLGVIKTMASIDQPPAILGGMIGGALVGTFLGVFLAYCIVGPIASRLKQIVEEEGAFYNVIRDGIVAILHDHSPAVASELARASVPTTFQPSFYDMEQAQKELRNAAS